MPSAYSTSSFPAQAGIQRRQGQAFQGSGPRPSPGKRGNRKEKLGKGHTPPFTPPSPLMLQDLRDRQRRTVMTAFLKTAAASLALAAILLGAALAGGPASAQEARSPSGQSYSVSLSGAVTCSVNFLEDEGDQSAWVMINCDPNGGRYPEGLATQWRLEGDRVGFMLDTGDPATARFSPMRARPGPTWRWVRPPMRRAGSIPARAARR